VKEWETKTACCDEFIRNLDQGYETGAGEAGRKLSGDEKQRIAIARAILKNAPIVILDEATAFTDPENEDKIQKFIQILVVNDGRIAQRGIHEGTDNAILWRKFEKNTFFICFILTNLR
jgi:ABC-type multidrug transport system fused ATPase/permease subunit